MTRKILAVLLAAALTAAHWPAAEEAETAGMALGRTAEDPLPGRRKYSITGPRLMEWKWEIPD